MTKLQKTHTKKDDFNALHILWQQLTKLLLDLIFIGGDFNIRVGAEPDFVTENINDLHFSPGGYELDIVNSSKNNQDISVNKYGQQLIDLSIASKLWILNVRTRGYFQRHVTYVVHHGCSTMAIVLSSEETLLDLAIIQYLSSF